MTRSAVEKADLSTAYVPGIDGLRAYELLTTVRPNTAVVKANEVIRKGWSLSAELPTIQIGGEIPWDSDEPTHRSWTFRLHCLDMIEALLVAHSATGKKEFLQPALDVALDWIARYPKIAKTNGSNFAWYDMAVGLRLVRFAYLYDAATRQNMLDDDTEKAFLASLQEHAAYMADDENIAFHSNHGFYQIAGHLALIRRLHDRLADMQQAHELAISRFKKMLRDQFTDEGVHREHSPDYHRMVYESLLGILNAGLVNDAKAIELSDKVEDALAWFVYPNGNLVNFGDSDSRSMLRSEGEIFSRWRGDYMLDAASGGVLGCAPSELTRSFPSSGYWVFRETGDSLDGEGRYLALAAAFHSRTHKHADDLNLVWYDRGEEILVDSGRYGYLGKTQPGDGLWEKGFWYSDPTRRYMESTRAHNTVEINGQDYPRKGASAYGSGIGRNGMTDEGIYFSEAEVKHFGSIRHARLLVYRPGDWLIVYDWLHDNNAGEHNFKQWFHLSPALSLQTTGYGFMSYLPSSQKPLQILSLLSQAQRMNPLIGQEADPIQGLYSPKEQRVMPNYALGYSINGVRTARFATLFCFGDEIKADQKESRSAVSGRDLQFSWAADGRRHGVSVSRPADGEIVLDYQES